MSSASVPVQISIQWLWLVEMSRVLYEGFDVVELDEVVPSSNSKCLYISPNSLTRMRYYCCRQKLDNGGLPHSKCEASPAPKLRSFDPRKIRGQPANVTMPWHPLHPVLFLGTHRTPYTNKVMIPALPLSFFFFALHYDLRCIECTA